MRKRLIIVMIILSVIVFTGIVGADNFKQKHKQIDSVGLKLVADGLTAPLALVSPDDRTGRIFIVDQTGVINILTKDGEMREFLNISSKIIKLDPGYDERGLLGLAFHPKFKKNGLFYVYYSIPLRSGAPVGWDHTNRISEFKVSNNDPNKADVNSERILLENDHPEFNHNAGQIAFGSDGYLYIPIGDGGAGNDIGLGHPPPGNGQNISTLLGKVLRIDVDGTPYKIPKDNPFVGKKGRDEIYAYGFRNPFHLSFDAKNGHKLFVSDAGQNLWEEVDMVEKGKNYGWHIKEGAHCFDPNNPDKSPATCPDVGANGDKLVDPIIEYANAHQPGGIGFVVVGGYVYRGNDLPKLKGKYIFGDFSNDFSIGNGTLFIGIPPKGKDKKEKMWQIKELQISTSKNKRINEFIHSFGQDSKNELYVLTTGMLGPSGNTGKVYKIIPGEN